MSNEQAQALIQQLQALETYMTDLLQREEAVVRLIQEAVSAIESIKSIDNNGESETLVPVGLGAYVKARIDSNQKIIVNIGAGISIEQDKGSAINYVESRIKELEIALQQLSSQRQEVASRIEQGQAEMNKLIQLNHQSTKQG